VFREVFKGQGGIVFGEGQEGIEEGHVDVDVVTDVAVVASGSRGAVDYVLGFLVLTGGRLVGHCVSVVK